VHRAYTAGALLALTAVGPAMAGHAADAGAKLRADLERFAQLRIYFGHQSVGMNLLDGIRMLAKTAGVAVRIVDSPTAGGVAIATFGHAWIGENGKPFLKLRAFERAMGDQNAGLDIAFMKFCFLDFTEDTDAKAVFAGYRAAIDELRLKHPGTMFVHVTTPLTDVQGGPKAWVKRLLNRPPYGTIENVRREEYNALLRQAYGGREPIFDLARVESTLPDGAVVTTEWQGKAVPALAPAYTEDGQHLNVAGKLRAGRGLVAVLAALPGPVSAAGRSR
jgi:hypothetical protein